MIAERQPCSIGPKDNSAMDNDDRQFLFSFAAIIGAMGLILLGVVALVQLTTDPNDESLQYMSATASVMG